MKSMKDYDLTDEDGVLLVQTARKIATEYITEHHRLELDEKLKERFSFDAGIFVTLNISSDLRGCIGFPMPRKLNNALVDAAIAAATEDPRFSPVAKGELDKITFEITVLTPPIEIKVDDPSQLASHIKVGKDGLIVRQGFYSGLLLPQVPVEYGWTEEEFLSHTCQKAGLPSNCWKDKKTTVYSFEGIIFKEETPKGKIIREKL
ncbi:MAG: TIGR00296 family protein [Candidatus Nitrosotenuis sp.]|nr:MAG: TIGR00296 family protein [Candidatus Nitrosotenuis sp.]